MTGPHRINAVALALAVASMGVAAYAVLTRPDSQAATCGACETQSLREQLARLERRIDAAERTATRHTVQRVASAATEPDRPAVDGVEPEPTDDAAPGEDANRPPSHTRTAPRFVEFETTERGLTVAQADNGAVGVRNTNPELAGRIIVLKARTEDGTLMDLPVTVPPAE